MLLWFRSNLSAAPCPSSSLRGTSWTPLTGARWWSSGGRRGAVRPPRCPSSSWTATSMRGGARNATSPSHRWGHCQVWLTHIPNLSVESQKGIIIIAVHMFHWVPEGCYHTKSMTIVPFWFSTEHCWTALMPFWFSTEHCWTALRPFWLSANELSRLSISGPRIFCGSIMHWQLICIESWIQRNIESCFYVCVYGYLWAGVI